MIRALLIIFVGSLPSLLLAAWAYAPGLALSYHSPEVLLLQPYAGAAEELPAGPMLVRGLMVVVALFFALFVCLRGDTSSMQQWFTGIAIGFCVVSPLWVPLVLGGMWRAALIPGLTTLSVGFGLVFLARKVPEIVLPLGLIVLLASTYYSVQTAGAVMIRSNPPLQILSWLAEGDLTPEHQLVGGLHFLSIGGTEEALPLLRAAGDALSERYKDDPVLYQAAKRLADIPLEQGQ